MKRECSIHNAAQHWKKSSRYICDRHIAIHLSTLPCHTYTICLLLQLHIVVTHSSYVHLRCRGFQASPYMCSVYCTVVAAVPTPIRKLWGLRLQNDAAITNKLDKKNLLIIKYVYSLYRIMFPSRNLFNLKLVIPDRRHNRYTFFHIIDRNC